MIWFKKEFSLFRKFLPFPHAELGPPAGFGLPVGSSYGWWESAPSSVYKFKKYKNTEIQKYKKTEIQKCKNIKYKIHSRTTRGLWASGRLFLWAVRVSSVFRYTGNQLITSPTLQTAAAIKCIATQRNTGQSNVKFHEVCLVHLSEENKESHQRWTGFQRNTILALIKQKQLFSRKFNLREFAHSVNKRSHLRIIDHARGKKYMIPWDNSMRNVLGQRQKIHDS